MSGFAVGVAGDHVGGVGLEADVAPVGGDRGDPAAVVALGAAGRDADALGHAGLSVVDEDVQLAVGVAGDQIGRQAGERDVAAVARDLGQVAEAVRLAPARGDADPLGDAGDPVVDEDVRGGVGVAGDQVGGAADERDIAAVVGDRRRAAAVVAGGDPEGLAGKGVLQEHVRAAAAVGIAGLDRLRGRGENDVAAVIARRRLVAAGLAVAGVDRLGARIAGADDGGRRCRVRGAAGEFGRIVPAFDRADVDGAANDPAEPALVGGQVVVGRLARGAVAVDVGAMNIPRQIGVGARVD